MAKQARKARIPVSGPRDILTVHGKQADKEYRFVLDTPGRIQRFEDGGWEKVTITKGMEVGTSAVDRGSVVGSVVTKIGGQGQTLVLMAIPKEWYDEDQKAKQDAITALEATQRADSMEGNYGSLGIHRK
mgnify:CR=1 FL=1